MRRAEGRRTVVGVATSLVEVVGAPLLAVLTLGLLLRTGNAAEVALWIAAQAVVASANVVTLGRNDLLVSALLGYPPHARQHAAAAAQRRVERTALPLALIWGAAGSLLWSQNAMLTPRSLTTLGIAVAIAAAFRTLETVATATARGAGYWERAAVLSATARITGSAAALMVLALDGSIALALLVQSAPGPIVRLLALPRATSVALGLSESDVGVRRAAPYFAQMLGNALLHSLDRALAVPILGSVGAAAYGITSQLTLPIHAVMWSAFIWIAEQGGATADTLPRRGVVARLATRCLSVLVLLLVGWVVAMLVLVPIILGPTAPRISDPLLLTQLGATAIFAVSVPAYYLLWRQQGGRTTGSMLLAAATLFGVLAVSLGSDDPFMFAIARVGAAIMLTTACWVTLWRRTAP